MTEQSAKNSSAPIRVAIIYGGRSSEHSVSCVTAGAIMSHLDPDAYEVFPVGITREGVWTVGQHDVTKLVVDGRTLPEVELTEAITLALDPVHKGQFTTSDGQLLFEADVVFPCLHGPFGEDGTIQGLFELSGVAYVGPGVLASAACMDKEYTKKILGAAGLAIGREHILYPGDSTDLGQQLREELGLPVFVKPARGGSSIGISRVTSWENFDDAVTLAREHDAKVIIESEIIGDEVEVGVLELPDGRVIASVPAQLQGTDEGEEGFYDFDTKYLDNVVAPLIPAPIGEEATSQLKNQAITAFRALGCRGLSRVDFFLTDNGPVVNEVNTMPGFTPISMYPQVLQASGYSYQQLLDILIERALSTN